MADAALLDDASDSFSGGEHAVVARTVVAAASMMTDLRGRVRTCLFLLERYRWIMKVPDGEEAYAGNTDSDNQLFAVFWWRCVNPATCAQRSKAVFDYKKAPPGNGWGLSA
ncbi:hypothetical protein Acsp01_06140 [Actinoplanes sp. NBRC 101535]|nr:hypothetical protein Acsp01_06140 [Actinoplanes sp. NBRC 101535]